MSIKIYCITINIYFGTIIGVEEQPNSREIVVFRCQAAGDIKTLCLTFNDYSFIVYLVIQSIRDVKVNG